MEEKELLIQSFVKTTGKTVEELQELLYEKLDGSEELTLKKDALDLLLKEDIARIETIKSKSTTEWEQKLEKVKNDQAGKVKKEALEELEKSLLSEFGIRSSDKRGVDLVKEIVALNTKTTLTPDEVKKHAAYLELEGKLKSEYIAKEEYEKVVNEYSSFKSGLEAKKTMGVVTAKALEIFREMNPVLSENANRRAEQEAGFVKLLTSGNNYQVSDDKILLVDAEGKRIEDSHGVAVAFDEHVKSFAETMHDFKVQDRSGNSNNNNSNNNNNNSSKEKPSSIEVFNKTKASLTGKELLDYHNQYCELFDIPKL